MMATCCSNDVVLLSSPFIIKYVEFVVLLVGSGSRANGRRPDSVVSGSSSSDRRCRLRSSTRRPSSDALAGRWEVLPRGASLYLRSWRQVIVFPPTDQGHQIGMTKPRKCAANGDGNCGNSMWQQIELTRHTSLWKWIWRLKHRTCSMLLPPDRNQPCPLSSENTWEQCWEQNGTKGTCII